MAIPIPQIFTHLDSDILDMLAEMNDTRYRIPDPIKNRMFDRGIEILKKIRDTAAESCGIDSITGLTLEQKAEKDAAALANSPFARKTTPDAATAAAGTAALANPATLIPPMVTEATAPAATMATSVMASDTAAPTSTPATTATSASASPDATSMAATTADLMGAAGITRSDRNAPAQPAGRQGGNGGGQDRRHEHQRAGR